MEPTRYSPRFWLANLRRVPEILVCSRETRQWLEVTLDYLGLRPVAYPFELRLRSGERVILREHMDIVVFWMVFARQHYPVAASHRVIVDIGANIGMYCAITGTAGEKTMDSARGIPSQYRRIYSPETATLNASHRGPVGLKQDDTGVPVRAETLAHVLDRAGVTVVDLVKMNIHGSEYEVVLSTDPTVLQRCRQIEVQYHELPVEMRLSKQQIFEHLRRLGFNLVVDDDTHRGSGRAVFGNSS